MKYIVIPNIKIRILPFSLLITLVLYSCGDQSQYSPKVDMSSVMIRIAEIEIYPEYTDKYIEILKEEAEASIRLEPGVISIYPLYQRNNPTQMRLLEIYASREAYESHLKTPHFQKYKTTTLEMVKSLELIDMEPIDMATMSQIFCKLQNRKEGHDYQ